MIELAIGLACAGCLAAIETFVIGTQAWEHLRFASGRLRSSVNDQTQAIGRALVIIPCRGLEQDLESNLRQFFQQYYDNFALRFVVESREDPAAEVIRRVIEEHPHIRAELVIAGLANGEAQKIHNLRAATESLPDEIEYLVFADSDAAPNRHWLGAMIRRLRDSRATAVTGYRWFVPSRGSLHEAVVYALNGAYAMLMSKNTPNLIWGGSWAIRKDVFNRLDIRSAWKGKICDDLVVAAQLLKRGLHVEYEPACLVETACQPDLKSVFAFASRQFFLLRHILPHWWLTDLLIGYFPTVVFWATFIVLLSTRHGLLSWISAAILVVLYALQWARAELRAAAAKTYFPALTSQPSFRRVCWFDRLLGPMIQLVGLLASLNGGLRRQIVWRGISYRIKRNGQIQINRPPEIADLVGRGAAGSGPQALTGISRTGAKDSGNGPGDQPLSLEKKQHSAAA
ncbi:MAG: glycosyltransferase [Thermogutta sp.]